MSKDGKTIYSKSIGIADQSKSPIHENTKFRIGSVTKTFTAALIMKAADENRLQLNDHLLKYFPQVTNADKITIAQLLAHRSGIHNFTDDAAYQVWQTLAKSDAEMIDIIVKGGSDFEPGTKAEYSNANYVLLSQILQKVYKQSYREILTQKILKPVGLAHTYYGGKINVKNNEAQSFSYAATWQPTTETDMSIPSGAGSIVSTGNDLGRFFEALFNGKIISAKGLEQMKTIENNYGMGLFRMPFNDKISYGHTGGIEAFSSMVSHFPDEKLTVAILSNGLHFDMNSIGIALLSSYFNLPFDIPTFVKHSYQPEELEKYTGVYASAQMPLKITVTRVGGSLTAQATGQSAFPLETSALNVFTFEPAGIVLEFKPEQKEMMLKQGGGIYTFTKS
jgi:CubicO group peptidase (beta-lactamase class C family)